MIKVYNFSGLEIFNVRKIIEWTNEYEAVLVAVRTGKLQKINKKTDYLDAEQLKKMNCYYKENDRENYFISHGIVNEIFSKVIGCEKRKIIWNREEKGKYYIINENNLNFNISHTKGCAIVALSRNAIGVDVEYMNKNFDYKDILKYSFADEESTYINDWKDFYKCWVAKESYLKYKGIGLFQDLDSVVIIKEYEDKVVIRDKQINKSKIVEIKEMFEDYIIAICF